MLCDLEGKTGQITEVHCFISHTAPTKKGEDKQGKDKREEGWKGGGKGGEEGGRVERRGVGRGGHEMRWEEQSDDRNKNKNDNKREKIRRCGRVRRT